MLGVKIVGLVSVKIDFVVVGFGVGLKLKKVVEFGIDVIDEVGWVVIVVGMDV